MQKLQLKLIEIRESIGIFDKILNHSQINKNEIKIFIRTNLIS